MILTHKLHSRYIFADVVGGVTEPIKSRNFRLARTKPLIQVSHLMFPAEAFGKGPALSSTVFVQLFYLFLLSIV